VQAPVEGPALRGRGLKGPRGPKEGRKGKQGGPGTGEQGEAEVDAFCWRCKSVGSFQGAAPGVPGASVMSSADFSSDGSLLAVASGACVTLWGPPQLLPALRASLPPPPSMPLRREPPAHPWLHAVTHVRLVGAGPESLVVTASLCAGGGAGERGQGRGGRWGVLGLSTGCACGVC